MADDSKKRLLALDGGGVLGLVTVMMLERVEDQLREAYGGDPDFRLRDFFDYIGGTSTGAIIAAGLALGKSIAELKHFYVNSGEQMFDRASLLKRWRYTYAADNLRDLLKQEFGAGSILDLQRDDSLSSEKHLLVVTRNVNTDSPWPVSTNPSAKYNDESRADCFVTPPTVQSCT